MICMSLVTVFRNRFDFAICVTLTESLGGIGIYMLPLIHFNRVLKNVMSACKIRQNSAKKRSL